MKLALAIHTPEVRVAPPVALLTGTFPERLKKAQRLGYHGVELMVASPVDLDMDNIKTQLRTCGLDVAAVASGPIFMQDQLTLLASTSDIARQAAERLDELIDMAATLESPLVTIGSFRGRQSQAGGNSAVLQLRDQLLAAAHHASRLGVRVAIEPLNRYETDLIHDTNEGLLFLAQADHPNLGLLLDTFHMNIEEADIHAALRQTFAAGKLFHIHLGDSNRLPPGKGHFNFAGLIQTLNALGYSGYLSAELLGIPDPDAAAYLTIEYMRQWIGIQET